MTDRCKDCIYYREYRWGATCVNKNAYDGSMDIPIDIDNPYVSKEDKEDYLKYKEEQAKQQLK